MGGSGRQGGGAGAEGFFLQGVTSEGVQGGGQRRQPMTGRLRILIIIIIIYFQVHPYSINQYMLTRSKL